MPGKAKPTLWTRPAPVSDNPQATDTGQAILDRLFWGSAADSAAVGLTATAASGLLTSKVSDHKADSLTLFYVNLKNKMNLQDIDREFVAGIEKFFPNLFQKPEENYVQLCKLLANSKFIDFLMQDLVYALRFLHGFFSKEQHDQLTVQDLRCQVILSGRFQDMLDELTTDYSKQPKDRTLAKNATPEQIEKVCDQIAVFLQRDILPELKKLLSTDKFLQPLALILKKSNFDIMFFKHNPNARCDFFMECDKAFFEQIKKLPLHLGARFVLKSIEERKELIEKLKQHPGYYVYADLLKPYFDSQPKTVSKSLATVPVVVQTSKHATAAAFTAAAPSRISASGSGVAGKAVIRATEGLEDYEFAAPMIIPKEYSMSATLK